MSVITPYMRLIVDNTARRETQGVQPLKNLTKNATAARTDTNNISPSPEDPGPAHVVKLIRQENRQAMDVQPPTAQEAEEALASLAQSLPGQGQEVGEIHSGLDRRVILSLLAPLVSV
jgi:hypothetical protein